LFAGDVLLVDVVNRYNTWEFNGEKLVVVATTSWLGTRNPVLGAVLVAAGGLAVLLGMIYLVVVTMRPRKLGDLSLLSDADWERGM